MNFGGSDPEQTSDNCHLSPLHKTNSRIYVGDSIVRKTDSTLTKNEGIVVCSPGTRIEQVTQRGNHGAWKWRVHTGPYRDEQRRQGRNYRDILS